MSGIFKGDFEHSTKTEMVSKLQVLRAQAQVAIDLKFPANKVEHVKTHAVASYVLRKGFYQAVGLLDSFLPFYDMMHNA